LGVCVPDWGILFSTGALKLSVFMDAAAGVVLCLAFVLGLWVTGVPGQVGAIPVGAIALPLLGLSLAVLMPRLWRTGPRALLWIAAGIVGLLAVLYFQVRLPQPDANDISTVLANPVLAEVGVGQAAPSVEVQGFVETPPRLTRSQKIQFELGAFRARVITAEGKEIVAESVTGRAYATVPLLQGTGLYPGQMVSVRGVLYEPTAAANPGGFDFRAYLAQQGMFVGLRGKQVDFPEAEGRFRDERTWQRSLFYMPQHWLWQVRQRIVRAQVSGLGVPEGPLVSAMLLGKSGVDVPHEVKDSFAQAGLAHALAASGFQVSLLIGIMLNLTRSLSPRLALPISIGTLLLYIGLTGLEPSVLRAGLMGLAVLLSLALERRIKSLGALILAATLLLLWNPIWIWNLGFQLSFLATLGLLVTAPVLTKWLDWMPTAIASLVAVPLAAYIWTLPLQLFVFGVVSPYSIVLNMLTALLITLISLGSGITALVALLSPSVGAALSKLMYFPAHGLIQMAELTNQLPGSSVATGTIQASQAIALYLLFVLVWWLPHLQRRWWTVGIVCIGLIAVPAWSAAATTVKVTVLATAEQPMLVVQNQGEVGLIGNSSEQDVIFTVLPFLRQRGINRINWAIAPTLDPDTTAGWYRLLQTIPVRAFHSVSNSPQGNIRTADQAATLPLDPNRTALFTSLQTQQAQVIPLQVDDSIKTAAIALRPLSLDPLALRFQIGDQIWLLLNAPDSSSALAALTPKLATLTSVLWWNGSSLDETVLAQISPKLAIASPKPLSPSTQNWFHTHTIPTFSTYQDGAIQWTPTEGFTSTLDVDG